MKKIIFKIVLLSLSVIALGGNAAPKKTPAQYWQETGFGLKELDNRKILTNPNCYKKEATFIACFEALKSLAENATPARTLIPAKHLQASAVKIQGTEKNYDSAIVLGKVKIRTEAEIEAEFKSKSKSQLKAESLQDREAIRKELVAIFKSKKLNVESVYTDLVKLAALNKENEAIVASEILNSYLSAAIDPHTYIVPRAMREEELSTGGAEGFVGIGVALGINRGKIFVERPIENGPAEKAGVLVGDVFLAVDGQSVAGMKVDAVVKLIRGLPNTTVELMFSRDGEVVKFNIVRAPIQNKNITYRVIPSAKKKVGYIRMNSFMDENGCLEMSKAIDSLKSEKVDALVYDLRSNSGGLLFDAVCIGGLFVGKKVIVIEKSLKQDSQPEELAADEDAITDLPLVILQNAGSASASEVLAGAMQDYRRAWIMGDRSYGKGSVQSSQPFYLESEAAAARLFGFAQSKVSLYTTIARFYQPSGRTNQIVGIIPNFFVKPRPDASDDDLIASREEDIYTNALPPLSKPWTETRPAEVASLKGCMQSSGNAMSEYERLKQAKKVADYQLLNAVDLLNCVK